jgi:putative hemolysin
MPGETLEIILVLLLILLNGVFATAEIAIVSARKVRLQQRAEDGDRKARKALQLAEDPNQFLSTVQIGITLIGILAGAYGGVAIAGSLAAALDDYPSIAPYSDAIAFTTVVVIITFLSLVLGELVPKRIALNRPEALASALAGPMLVISKITQPAVRLLGGATNLVLKILRIKPSDEPVVTEEEIEMVLAQGARAGIIEEAEHDLLERVFRFGDQSIAAFMTPRRDVVYLDIDHPIETISEKILAEPHSYFVVCRGGLDNPLGVVDVKQLLVQAISGEPIDIEKALRQPLFVPETVPALQVLDRFRRTSEHVALVVNEYGGIEGVVTMNDVTEALVGELPLPGEAYEPGIIEREDGTWLVDGMLSIEEFRDYFDLRDLPGEDTGHFRTVGGFVLNSLGRIPSAGEAFEFDDVRVEVMDMDGNRVDKVLITRHDVPEEED